MSSIVASSSHEQIRDLDRLFDLASDRAGQRLLFRLKKGPLLVGELDREANNDFAKGGTFSETEALGRLFDWEDLGIVKSEWVTKSPQQKAFCLTDAGKNLADALEKKKRK